MYNELYNLLSLPKSKILQKFPTFNLKIHENVILFGAAQLGTIYIRLCKKNKINVSAICDNDRNKINGRIEGIQIISVEDLKKFPKDISIIITSQHDEAIYKQLISLGYSNIWNHMYFSTFFPYKFSNIYWSNSFTLLKKHKTELFACMNILADKYSQKTLLNIIKFRIFLDRSYLKQIVNSNKDEYFDEKIIPLKNESEVFIDGGAYNGDTILKFIQKSNNKFKNIYAFEPDIESFNLLKKNINQSNDPRIKIYRMALDSKKNTLGFTNDGTPGSRITRSSNTTIQTTDLDTFLRNDKPTIIKLDVESYEKNALLGCKNIISNYHPKLAISIYHKTSHLWKIPLLIKNLYPGYKLYLRHYTTDLYDTICYAVE